VQLRYAERAANGSRVELWPASPLVSPSDCPPNLFCFPRRGTPTRFKWKKVRDPDELFTPGLHRGRFKQRDNEFSFVLNGRSATIAAPTDALPPPAQRLFLLTGP
jgi:hypothetical protein